MVNFLESEYKCHSPEVFDVTLQIPPYHQHLKLAISNYIKYDYYYLFCFFRMEIAKFKCDTLAYIHTLNKLMQMFKGCKQDDQTGRVSDGN